MILTAFTHKKIKEPKNIGFSMLSIRTDYVEGAEKSPTGYLEGIYVEPEYGKEGYSERIPQN